MSSEVNFSPGDVAGVGDVPVPSRRLLRRGESTFPHKRLFRSKPRRWPLVLRFRKGAIHRDICLAVLLHALFTVVIVCLRLYVLERKLGLPPNIVPALSIVVGLMLVFRNQTSYQRFWDGRNNLTVMISCVRNLARAFLSCSAPQGKSATEVSDAERADVERSVRILMALPISAKNTLRAEWGAAWAPLSDGDVDLMNGHITPRLNPDYAQLLPPGFRGHEHDGLAMPLQLTVLIEAFIRRGHDRGWFHSPQASQLWAQLNTLVDAFGRMETIQLTGLPIAILIHQRQVMALFGMVLPFAIVDESRWWSVLIVSVVMFTLYGIEAIALQLEDPFGYERNDIRMDDIAEDVRTEIGVLLDEWKGMLGVPIKKEMFIDVS